MRHAIGWTRTATATKPDRHFRSTLHVTSNAEARHSRYRALHAGEEQCARRQPGVQAVAQRDPAWAVAACDRGLPGGRRAYGGLPRRLFAGAARSDRPFVRT